MDASAAALAVAALDGSAVALWWPLSADMTWPSYTVEFPRCTRFTCFASWAWIPTRPVEWMPSWGTDGRWSASGLAAAPIKHVD